VGGGLKSPPGVVAWTGSKRGSTEGVWGKGTERSHSSNTGLNWRRGKGNPGKNKELKEHSYGGMTERGNEGPQKERGKKKRTQSG